MVHVRIGTLNCTGLTDMGSKSFLFVFVLAENHLFPPSLLISPRDIPFLHAFSLEVTASKTGTNDHVVLFCHVVRAEETKMCTEVVKGQVSG
jgi:hypothetical protein